jgi:hypothetical protein
MKYQIFCCLVLGAVSTLGSTITSASTSTVTGTPYTVTVTADSTTGALMAGMILTANYTTGGSLTCTWLATGSCTSGASGFTVSYPSADNTHPQVNDSNWVIANNRTGFLLASLTIDGIPGLTGFDRCMTGSSTFNDANPGGTTGTSCTTVGTPTSNIGFSVGSGNASGNGGAGTAGISGTVTYQNALHLAAASAVGDLWGQVTIAFTGTSFTSGSTFTFRSDSDTLGSATLDVASVPEPGTFGAMGLALLGISIGFRRRKSKI